MIFITDAEKIQLEEFLIDRQWKPGTTPDTWIQFRPSADIDLPFFFLAAERHSEDVYEVGGMPIGDTWSDEDTRGHIVDILRAGTDYGSRCNVEAYLQRLGIENPQAHAINLLRVFYGEVEVPPPPTPQVRTLFYDASCGWGWIQFKWKGGESIHLTTSIKSVDADGYATYSGYIRSCHGLALPFPSGIFGDRRKSGKSNNIPESGDRRRPPRSLPVGQGDRPEPVEDAGLQGLPEEVLLEVRGESRGGPSGDEPGSGERDA